MRRLQAQREEGKLAEAERVRREAAEKSNALRERAETLKARVERAGASLHREFGDFEAQIDSMRGEMRRLATVAEEEGARAASLTRQLTEAEAQAGADELGAVDHGMCRVLDKHTEGTSLVAEAEAATASLRERLEGARSQRLPSLTASLSSAYWPAGSAEEELAEKRLPEVHAARAALDSRALGADATLLRILEGLQKVGASLADTAFALSASKERVISRRRSAVAAPHPPGSRSLLRRPLSEEEEAAADAALGAGAGGELLSEFADIPVRRDDMRTLRPGTWLNDEVRLPRELPCTPSPSRPTLPSPLYLFSRLPGPNPR